MPDANVELIRAAYGAWNRGDLETALRHVHPEVEFVQDPRIPGAVSLVGRDAVRAWLESFEETWESFQVATERIESIGDRILVIARLTARGRSSEVEVQQRVGHVLTMRNGQTIRWTSFADADEAAEAVLASE